MIPKRAETEEACWQNLANAIIIQAAKDYRAILKRLKKHPDNKTLTDQQRVMERFFVSKWFKTLCDLEGRALNSRIRKEVGV